MSDAFPFFTASRRALAVKLGRFFVTAQDMQKACFAAVKLSAPFPMNRRRCIQMNSIAGCAFLYTVRDPHPPFLKSTSRRISPSAASKGGSSKMPLLKVLLSFRIRLESVSYPHVSGARIRVFPIKGLSYWNRFVPLVHFSTQEFDLSDLSIF